eukprot:PITA_17837
MDLPGFRFSPTDAELLGFYLMKRIQAGDPMIFDKIIPTLDLYQYEPWQLPGLVHAVGEQQWFFFVPRSHKKCSGANRQTGCGYWKATGADRAVRNELLHCIGLKKFLVFYEGKVPHGRKTDWIMNEYRIPNLSSSASLKKSGDMVLCRIYRKAVTQKSIEQRAKAIDVCKDEPVASSDKYEEKFHLLAVNGSCQSDPMPESNVSSLQYVDPDGALSCLSKTRDESSLFDCLEPIMCFEESMVLKTPKSCNLRQLELPNLSMDLLFSQPIETPYALLSTRSPFDIP